MPLLQAKIWSVQKNVNLLKKKLAFYRSFWYIKQVAKIYGSLVKRLRRRPLTAKTGVRFPYELLKVSQTSFSFKNSVLYHMVRWSRG